MQIQGKVSECLVSQNVQVVAECYAPVAYQRNQKQTSQGLEVDLLIKVLHVKQLIRSGIIRSTINIVRIKISQLEL